jgi:capsular polysaccharide transport system permease protein
MRAARPRRRHWAAVISFALLVALPAMAVTAYAYLRAADQYDSTVAFSVRGAESSPAVGLLGALGRGVSTGGVDAEIVYEFVRSQQMVEAAAAALPLERMFNRPERDVLLRLGEDRPIEDIVDYWNWMTDVSFDGASGLVRFQVRAFDPGDAEAIAAFVLGESTRIVNDLSRRAREDAIAVAREAVGEAETRLREARRAMREFRDRAQEVDPSENARAALGLVAQLEEDLARARIELDSQLALVGAGSPRVAPLRQHIASLEKQIVEERARLGAGDIPSSEGALSRALASAITDYEELQVDLEFAQNAYVSALSAFEQAQIEARRQSRFLAPHVGPTRSVEPQHPRRAVISLAAFGLLCALWAVGLLIAYNIRDRR